MNLATNQVNLARNLMISYKNSYFAMACHAFYT